MPMDHVEPLDGCSDPEPIRSHPVFSFGQDLRKEDLEEGKARSNSKGSQQSVRNNSPKE